MSIRLRVILIIAFAPPLESPFRSINTVLMVVGIIGFVLCVVAAVIASVFIKKPFEQVKALQEDAPSGSIKAQPGRAGAPPAGNADIDIDIPGIDSDKMKARYQNESRIYLSVLRSYAENAAQLVEKLRDVTEDTLADYTINVHGLKGISANICADEIESEAAKLEELSKSGTIIGIPERNMALLASTSALVGEINAWFADGKGGADSGAGTAVKDAPDLKVLERLLLCCEQFDIEGADKAMEELEKTRYENGGELVSWLRDKLTDSQFTEIAGRLKAVVDKGSL